VGFREVIRFLCLIQKAWIIERWISFAEVGGLVPVKNIPSKVVIWLNPLPTNRMSLAMMLVGVMLKKDSVVGEENGVVEGGEVGVEDEVVEDGDEATGGTGAEVMVAEALTLIGGITADGIIVLTMSPPCMWKTLILPFKPL
jgi:hypothetical protein